MFEDLAVAVWFTTKVWPFVKRLWPFRKRSQLEIAVKRDRELTKFVRARIGRHHAGSYRDVEAIGPVLDASGISRLINDQCHVFLESGTAIAEYLRHLSVAHPPTNNIEVSTNSALVDVLVDRRREWIVRRMVGGHGYDPSYAAHYAGPNDINALIQTGGPHATKLILMTASAVDIDRHGPHSKEKNAIFKRDLINAARPVPNEEDNWSGCPVVFLTEINKVNRGMQSSCTPVYWNASPRAAEGMDGFLKDIREGNVLWIIYSADPIKCSTVYDALDKKLRGANVDVRELGLAEDNAYALLVGSKKWGYFQNLKLPVLNQLHAQDVVDDAERAEHEESLGKAIGIKKP